jgi:hypothetical protein
VPKVGLELHYSPCKHWAPAETSGIRPDPTYVQPSPKPKVWTLSTLLFVDPSTRTRSPHSPMDEHGNSELVALRTLHEPAAAWRGRPQLAAIACNQNWSLTPPSLQNLHRSKCQGLHDLKAARPQVQERHPERKGEKISATHILRPYIELTERTLSALKVRELQ